MPQLRAKCTRIYTCVNRDSSKFHNFYSKYSGTDCEQIIYLTRDIMLY